MTTTQEKFPQVSVENLIQKVRFDNKVSERLRWNFVPNDACRKVFASLKNGSDIHRTSPMEGCSGEQHGRQARCQHLG
jgi:hypothetical protein